MTNVETKTIARLDREKSSRNGNPRFRITFTDYTWALTAPDAGFVYGLENRENFGVPLSVHTNGRGHVTYVEPVK